MAENINAKNIEKPLLKIEINNDVISLMEMQSFTFIASEDNIIPKCVIRLKDLGSSILLSYNGIKIGDYIKASIIEGNETNAYISSLDTKSISYSFPPLVVSSIASNMKSLVEGSSSLEILCEHPWKMYQDFSSSIFVDQPNSEIIKSFISNPKGRSFKFNKINEDFFKKSDEDGSIPRYKCGEGDLEFIKNKLLPYTSINKSPTSFWVDENNSCHLDSFQNMFTKESSAVIYGGDFGDIPEEAAEKAKSCNGLLLGKEFILEVGNQDSRKIFKIIKNKISYDDLRSLKTMSGIMLPKLGIDTKNKSLPISIQSMLYNQATGSEDLTFHPLNDLLTQSLNSQNPLNSFFKMEITTTFCGLQVTTGDNVDLIMPKVDDKVPWISGKWHVKEIRHEWTAFNKLLNSKLTLIRPCFVESNNSSIENFSMFFKAGDMI